MSAEGTLQQVRCLVEGTENPEVRRKLVVFRRLEPGDVRSPGSHVLPHSPYLEAKLVEVGLSQTVHDDMVRVDKKRRETLTAGRSLLHTFDIPGMLLGASGGGIAGTYLGYMPHFMRPYLWVLFGAGVVMALVTRVLRQRAELEAVSAWKATGEFKEYERLGRELSEGWTRFGLQVKRELDFHVLLRVGEGSTEPQRLCSIDPRGFEASPPTFDPEDWLPTEGGGVRYEEVDVMGELVTRGLDGVDDVGESKEAPGQAKEAEEPRRSKAPKSKQAAEASKAPQSEASSKPEEVPEPKEGSKSTEADAEAPEASERPA
jgi:hypothetical protein